MAVDQQVIAADIHQIGDQIRPKGDHRIARAALCRIDSHGQYVEDHATHDDPVVSRRHGMRVLTRSAEFLTPPMWLFPVVWSILFVLMGIASYLVVMQKGEDTKALTLYAVQLIFNFFWSIWFFNLGWYLFAFLWLVALWILIIATTVAFYRISKPAAWLMLPYLVWVAFAGYLNLGVWWLNR